MSDASTILEDQVIHVKRGRTNGLGFEPAFNSYFEFYLCSKYFDPPLLQMEDVTFHLYLRKNINDRQKDWRMPTIRQMMKHFSTGQRKLNQMMERLAAAHLLTKQSGWSDTEKIMRNDYILSDPIPTLAEFLTVASEGVFGRELQPEFSVREMNTLNQETPVSVREVDTLNEASVREMNTPSVREMDTDQQTSINKQTAKTTDEAPPWEKALEDLRFHLGPNRFEKFLDGATLLKIENGIAVICTPLAYAKDFIGNRLSGHLCRSLSVEKILVVVESVEIEEVPP